MPETRSGQIKLTRRPFVVIYWHTRKIGITFLRITPYSCHAKTSWVFCNKTFYTSRYNGHVSLWEQWLSKHAPLGGWHALYSRLISGSREVRTIPNLSFLENYQGPVYLWSVVGALQRPNGEQTGQSCGHVGSVTRAYSGWRPPTQWGTLRWFNWHGPWAPGPDRGDGTMKGAGDISAFRFTYTDAVSIGACAPEWLPQRFMASLVITGR